MAQESVFTTQKYHPVTSAPLKLHARHGAVQMAYLHGRVKRVMDILVASVGLVLCAVPVAIAAIIIKCMDHVPVLFRQDRFGLDGKPFGMYKLRTLTIVETDQTVTPMIMERKPRNLAVTRTGSFWRKTSIDEMPQFWNVLKGEMSLVGHRPFPYYYSHRLKELDICHEGLTKCDLCPEDIESYLNIISRYKPGLIGYSSVNGRSDLSFQEKMCYDAEYAAQASLWLDIKILFRAVIVVLTAKGAW